MPYLNMYLPQSLEALLEHESAAQATSPGRLVQRAVIGALTGIPDPHLSRTREVVEAMNRGHVKLEDIAREAGATVDFTRNVLNALACLKLQGKSGPGVVELVDVAGEARWTMTAPVPAPVAEAA